MLFTELFGLKDITPGVSLSIVRISKPYVNNVFSSHAAGHPWILANQSNDILQYSQNRSAGDRSLKLKIRQSRL